MQIVAYDAMYLSPIIEIRSNLRENDLESRIIASLSIENVNIAYDYYFYVIMINLLPCS